MGRAQSLPAELRREAEKGQVSPSQKKNEADLAKFRAARHEPEGAGSGQGDASRKVPIDRLNDIAMRAGS